jgi:hypothetical protein
MKAAIRTAEAIWGAVDAELVQKERWLRDASGRVVAVVGRKGRSA